MDSIEVIKLMKEDVRDEINRELRRLTTKFKDYVSVDHEYNPKFTLVDGICTRINYGCKDDTYFWCYLPDDVNFIHLNKIWISNMIFYNSKLNWWYVYNRDNKQYVEFNEMDTDSQIKMLEMFKKHLGL
jgi:hypothetical protein